MQDGPCILYRDYIMAPTTLLVLGLVLGSMSFCLTRQVLRPDQRIADWG